MSLRIQVQKSSTKFYQTESNSTFKELYTIIKWDFYQRASKLVHVKTNIINHHINRLKESIDVEKEFDKIQHLFTIKKNSTNLEIEGNDIKITKFSSVQFSHSVVSDSLQPHESQHTRPPCPSPTPGVHSDSCPSSQ